MGGKILEEKEEEKQSRAMYRHICTLCVFTERESERENEETEKQQRITI